MSSSWEDIKNTAETLNELLSELTDKQRMEVFEMVSDGYCNLCGSKVIPCYCVCDD